VKRGGLGRHGLIDENAGDPLDGLVNLFDVGMILAVAFLIAGLGLTLNAKGDKLEVRTGRTAGAAGTVGADARSGRGTGGAAPGSAGGTGERQPGAGDGGAATERTIPNPAGGPRASGRGTPVGQVYRLPDGRLVYVKEPRK